MRRERHLGSVKGGGSGFASERQRLGLLSRRRRGSADISEGKLSRFEVSVAVLKAESLERRHF